VRARFQFVVLTGVAIEMQDFLSVRTAHGDSLPRCGVVEKRTTMLQGEISP
jgi:hypothetical protein